MSELPDPSVVSACAALARSQAVQLRARAMRLAQSAQACGWVGPAARAFRVEAEVLVARLHLAARHVDDAADLLERHAAIVRDEVAAQQRRRADELAHLRKFVPPVLGGDR